MYTDFNFCSFQKFVNKVGGIGPYIAYDPTPDRPGDRLKQYGFRFWLNYLEETNGRLWMPSYPGVYAINCAPYDPNNHGIPTQHILYIGSSQNIFKRVYDPNHWYMKIRERWALERRYILWIDVLRTKDYQYIEKCLIQEIRPLLNVHHKPHLVHEDGSGPELALVQ